MESTLFLILFFSTPGFLVTKSAPVFPSLEKIFEVFKWPHLKTEVINEDQTDTTVSPIHQTSSLASSPSLLNKIPRSFSWPLPRNKRQDALNNNLNSRSLCQWNYTVDHDESRIPKNLYIANCLSPTYMSYTCERVKTEVLVLKQLANLAWTTKNVVISTSCVVAKSPGTNTYNAIGSTT